MQRDTISDLPIEERHAIVVAWLNTAADAITRLAAQRDEARKELATAIAWIEDDTEHRPTRAEILPQLRAALGS